MLPKLSLSLALVALASSYGDEYTERACDRVFHVNTSTLTNNRNIDNNFAYFDPMCCCNDEILDIFKERTEQENQRVNPATDTMLISLGEYEKTIRYTIKQVKNLKQINAMYSFPEPKTIRESNASTSVSSGSSGGCEPLDFANEADREKYLEVIDRMENGGAGDGAYSIGNENSSAFGRYQIINSTANSYCGRTNLGVDCCAEWKSSPECQDAMFELITQDNIRGLEGKEIPLNTCTLYLAHQQGLGGLYWLFGGSNPYGNISALQEAVKQNVGSSWDGLVSSGADINDPDVLRQAYLEHWNAKLGGDILNSDGEKYSPEDFEGETLPFIEYADKRRSLWREGILKEMQNIKFEMEKDR